MKIKVFEEYKTDYPKDKIVCLSHFNDVEVNQFINFIQTQSENKYLELSGQPFITDSDCTLKFTIEENGNGIDQITPNDFECKLSLSDYEGMIDLIRNLGDSPVLYTGFQWLYDKNNPIDFLMSNTGKW